MQPVDTPGQTRMTRMMAGFLTFGWAAHWPIFMAGPSAHGCCTARRLRGLEVFGARSGAGSLHLCKRFSEDGFTRHQGSTPPPPCDSLSSVSDQHAAIKSVLGRDGKLPSGPGLETADGTEHVALFLSLLPAYRNIEDFGPLAFPAATREMLEKT